MKAIIQYLKQRGFGCIDETFYDRIKLWSLWYTGLVPSFHNYRQYNGRNKIRRTRKSLGMAKTIAEDWANLALNEKVGISVEEKNVEQQIWDVLDANKFRVRGNQLLEETFALGTGAFVERKDGDEIKIDYIRAGMIYPLAWDNRQISECAFASERVEKNEPRVYLNIHRLDSGNYVIENHLFRRNGSILTEIDLPEDVDSEVHTNSKLPRFQILQPNIVNNQMPDCPMGISVYANAIDQLEGLDLVYDSYCNEFRLGKKRITVPMTMAQIRMEEDGTITPMFDDNDTEFYAMPTVDGVENKIQEHNMTIRHEAHEAGIQTALNLLSFKCGMGKDRFNFQDGQVKTATEIVSEKSDLYQSLKKHELLLEDALISLTRTIADMLELDPELEITVNFDDSIIEDSNSEQQKDLQLVSNGIMAKWEYRVKWFGEDEQTARSMVEEASGGYEGLTFDA